MRTHKACAVDLEDFRHWCKQYEREWLPATPKTIGLYLGARSTLERRLAAIASLHKEEGHESPASVAEGQLRRSRAPPPIAVGVSFLQACLREAATERLE